MPSTEFSPSSRTPFPNRDPLPLIPLPRPDWDSAQVPAGTPEFSDAAPAVPKMTRPPDNSRRFPTVHRRQPPPPDSQVSAFLRPGPKPKPLSGRASPAGT